MKGDRLRINCENGYIQALGLAMFTFARLEWAAVWCAEKIEPGCINRLADRTAGNIARKLVELAPLAPDDARREKLIEAAEEFVRLVGRRNDIAHAKPCTAPDGAQRLDRRGEILTVEVIDAASDDFVACEVVLVELLHAYLNAPG